MKKYTLQIFTIIFLFIFTSYNLCYPIDLRGETLSPVLSFQDEAFKGSYTLSSICRYIEQRLDIYSDTLINDIRTWARSNPNPDIWITSDIPHEITIEVLSEGLAVRYYVPSETHPVATFNDVITLEKLPSQRSQKIFPLYKSDFARRHAQRVEHIAMLLSEELGLSEEMIEKISYACAIHDINTPEESMHVPPKALEKVKKSLVEKGVTIPRVKANDIDTYNDFVKLFSERREDFTQEEIDCVLDLFQGPDSLRIANEEGVSLTRSQEIAVLFHHNIDELEDYLHDPARASENWSEEEKKETILIASILVCSDITENGMNLFKKVFVKNASRVEEAEETRSWIERYGIPENILIEILAAFDQIKNTERFKNIKKDASTISYEELQDLKKAGQMKLFIEAESSGVKEIVPDKLCRQVIHKVKRLPAPAFTEEDRKHMLKLVEFAQEKIESGELSARLPVVARIVNKNGQAFPIVTREKFERKKFGVSAFHAELQAIREAEKQGFSDWENATMYVIIDSCYACSRILTEFYGFKRVVYGVEDPTLPDHARNKEGYAENNVELVECSDESIRAEIAELFEEQFKSGVREHPLARQLLTEEKALVASFRKEYRNIYNEDIQVILFPADLWAENRDDRKKANFLFGHLEWFRQDLNPAKNHVLLVTGTEENAIAAREKILEEKLFESGNILLYTPTVSFGVVRITDIYELVNKLKHIQFPQDRLLKEDRDADSTLGGLIENPLKPGYFLPHFNDKYDAQVIDLHERITRAGLSGEMAIDEAIDEVFEGIQNAKERKEAKKKFIRDNSERSDKYKIVHLVTKLWEINECVDVWTPISLLIHGGNEWRIIMGLINDDPNFDGDLPPSIEAIDLLRLYNDHFPEDEFKALKDNVMATNFVAHLTLLHDIGKYNNAGNEHEHEKRGGRVLDEVFENDYLGFSPLEKTILKKIVGFHTQIRMIANSEKYNKEFRALIEEFVRGGIEKEDLLGILRIWILFRVADHAVSERFGFMSEKDFKNLRKVYDMAVVIVNGAYAARGSRVHRTEGIHALSFMKNFELIQSDSEKRLSYIALGTSWIKGYGEDSSQHKAINPLISALRNFCQRNKIDFIEGDDKYVAQVVKKRKEKAIKGEYKERGIVLAEESIIENIIERYFKSLGIQNENDILLAGVDNRRVTEKNYIRLVEMLRLLTYISDKGIDSIDKTVIQKRHSHLGFRLKNGRVLFDLPRAVPMKYEELIEVYKPQIFA